MAVLQRWLDGTVAPTLMLWLFWIAFGIASAVGPDAPDLPKRADFVVMIVLPLIIASWVTADAHKHGLQLCYDYDSFIYCAWPFVVPIYLFQTRGIRAFVTLLCFAGMWLVAAIIGAIVLLIREPLA